MTEFDAMCAKDLRANIEQPPNEEFNEVTDDDNLESNFHTSEEVNPKKGAKSRQKYIKNKDNMYACEYCDSSYTQSHNLRKHIANKHPTKVTAL